LSEAFDADNIIMNLFELETPSAKDLESMNPDLVIVDISLSRLEVEDALELVNSGEACPPLILAADSWHEENAMQGVEEGAYDYVIKPVTERHMKLVIRRAIEFRNLLNFQKDHATIMEDRIHEETLEIVQTKDFLKGILDSSTLVAVILTDPNEKVLFWNKGAENIFGHSSQEMVGANVSALYPPGPFSKDAVEQLRNVVRNRSGAAHGKMKLLNKRQSVLTLSLALTPMFDAYQKVIGVLWVGLDVSETVRQNREIVNLLNEVRKTQDVAIFTLAKLTESRGEETGGHLTRVPAYCRAICNRLARRPGYEIIMDPKFVDDLARSSVLHDIGMVAMPDSIIWAPHRLHPKERELLAQHPVVGGKALEEAVNKLGENSFLKIAMEVAYYHHERWDGQGYPFKVSGNDIPIAARIVALADVYDTLTSERPNKRAISHDEARTIILAEKGIRFDPEIVDVFEEISAEFAEIRKTIAGS
jgi:PAS domain S-box-containing protein